MNTEDIQFPCGEFRLAATRHLDGDGRLPRMLTILGLGATASRSVLDYLLFDLAQYGQGAVSFDFSGNGDSTGIFEDSCLRRRHAETIAAAQLLDGTRRPILLGTSMGGHLGAWITPVLNPSTLILFCPAAYPSYAIDLKFDGNLARPWCYPNAPSLAGIREFTGDLLVIAAKEDKVVPRELIDAYVDHASQARSKSVHWLDCDHFIHRWLPHHAEARAEVVRQILQTIALSQQEPRTPC